MNITAEHNMTGYREFYMKYVLRKNQNVGVEHDRHGFRVRLTEDDDKRSTLLIYIKSHKRLSSCCQDTEKCFNVCYLKREGTLKVVKILRSMIKGSDDRSFMTM